MINSSKKTSNGFTLMELLISIAIFGIVIAGLVGAKFGQQDQTITQQQAVEMQQTVRAAMHLMTGELRMAGYNPSFKSYDTGITVANATSITFNRVANDDGVNNDGDLETDEDGELATFTYTIEDEEPDGDFEITFNGLKLAENIQALNFAYFDEDNNVTADLDEIRSVQITITATTSAGEMARSDNNNTRTLSTLVYIRNLGF